MKVFIVRLVTYDAGRLGRCWNLEVCASQKIADQVAAEMTKPVSYRDGLRPYRPYTHKEKDDKHGIKGWLGPSDAFVYITEHEVEEDD
jgi:hypothetical protein